jgi:hypothetical protein
MKPQRTHSPDHAELRLWLSRALIVSLRLEAIKQPHTPTLSELVEQILTDYLNGGDDHARS